MYAQGCHETFNASVPMVRAAEHGSVCVRTRDSRKTTKNQTKGVYLHFENAVALANSGLFSCAMG